MGDNMTATQLYIDNLPTSANKMSSIIIGMSISLMLLILFQESVAGKVCINENCHTPKNGYNFHMNGPSLQLPMAEICKLFISPTSHVLQ